MNDLFQSISELDEIYQDYPAFSAAKTQINRAMQLYLKTGIAEHLLITGESGTGKSTLVKLISQKYPPHSTHESDVLPVLAIKIPSEATIGGTAELMLRALGIERPTGNNTNKTHQIITLIKRCKVLMVMLDEAQHILDKGGERTHYQVADWLKSLMDAVNVPFVLLGLPRSRTLLAINGQLRRRFMRQLNLQITDHGSLPLHRVCLELFDGLLRSQQIRLTEQDWDDLGMRLVYASNGTIAYLKRLAIDTVTLAYESQSELVTQEMLTMAFMARIWTDCPAALNPFSRSFCGRALTQPGEPYAPEAIPTPSRRRKAA